MNHNGNSPMPSPEITWIDLEKWPRRTHFESFTTYSRCMIHASAKIDVTALHGACKATGRRFYPAMIVRAAGWHIARFFRELQARCDAPDALSRPEGASLS